MHNPATSHTAMLRRKKPKQHVDKPVTGRHVADVELIAKLRRFETLRVNVLPYLPEKKRTQMLSPTPEKEAMMSRSFNFRALGYAPLGSNWLLNAYLEGNDSLRRNLEGLVANAAIIAALLVTVTLGSLLDGNGANYFSMEDTDTRHEAFDSYGVAYVYLLTIATMAFFFTIFAAADFYYHVLGFPANDFELMLMFLTQNLSYETGVINCTQFSTVGVTSMCAAMFCKLASMSSLSVVERACLIIPFFPLVLVFFYRMNRITAAAWTVEMVTEARIEQCYEDPPNDAGERYLRLKQPWASLVGKVELFPVVRIQCGDNLKRVKSKLNPHDVCLPAFPTAMVNSSIVEDFMDTKPANIVSPSAVGSFAGFDDLSPVADWPTILEHALPDNPSNAEYVNLIKGLDVEDVSHLEFDSLKEVLQEVGIASIHHRVKIVNAVLGTHA
eukprot:m.30397 g.30397  ORF g.30397 m.30397 type:complete len:442 (-) comp16278_c0_seq1:221-1546(-)